MSKMDCLDKDAVAAILNDLAHGRSAKHPFVYDELPKLEKIPRDWEDVVIEASKANVDNDREYLFLCAELLIGMQSSWDGLPTILQRLVMRQPGELTFHLIRQYAIQRHWNMPQFLKDAVSKAINRLSPFQRFALRFDSKSQELLRSCV